MAPKKIVKKEIAIKNRYLIFSILVVIAVAVFLSGMAIYKVGDKTALYKAFSKERGEGLRGCMNEECVLKYIQENIGSLSIEDCSSTPYKDVCMSMLSREKALAGNVDACSYVDDAQEQDSCYFAVALSLSNEAYCTKIKDTTLREMCLNNVGGA